MMGGRRAVAVKVGVVVAVRFEAVILTHANPPSRTERLPDFGGAVEVTRVIGTTCKARACDIDAFL